MGATCLRIELMALDIKSQIQLQIVSGCLEKKKKKKIKTKLMKSRLKGRACERVARSEGRLGVINGP